jgi:hypothetical protein
MRKKLGEILIDAGLIDEDQLASGLGEQTQWGGKLGTALISKGFITEADLLRCLAIQQGIKSVSLKDMDISLSALRTMKAEEARKFNVVPVHLDKKVLTVAMANPTDLKTIDALRFTTGKNIRPILALDPDLGPLIDRFYDRSYKGPPARPSGMAEAAVESPRRADTGGITIEQTVASLITLLIKKELISEEEFIAVLNDID